MRVAGVVADELASLEEADDDEADCDDELVATVSLARSADKAN